MVFTPKMESRGEDTPSDMLIDLQACIELNRPGDEASVDTQIIRERMRAIAESVAAVEAHKDGLLGDEPGVFDKVKAKAEAIISEYEKMLEAEEAVV